MSKTIIRAIESNEAQELFASGLKLVSTNRQLKNGTIAFAGTVAKQKVSYKITAAGNVVSNGFAARTVSGAYPLQQYRAGLKAASQLLAKRIA